MKGLLFGYLQLLGRLTYNEQRVSELCRSFSEQSRQHDMVEQLFDGQRQRNPEQCFKPRRHGIIVAHDSSMRIDDCNEVPTQAVYSLVEDTMAQLRYQVKHGNWTREFKQRMARLARTLEDFTLNEDTT